MNFLASSQNNIDIGMIIAIVLGVALIVTLVVFIVYTVNLKKSISFIYTVVNDEADATIDSALDRNETAKRDMKKGVIKDYGKQKKETAKEYDKKIKETNKIYEKQIKAVKKEANEKIKIAKKENDVDTMTQIRENLEINVRNIGASKRAEVEPIVAEKNDKLKELENRYKPSLVTFQRVLTLSRHTKPLGKILKNVKEKGYTLPDYDKQ